MQLNELLEAYTLHDIAKKTNISEENLDALFNKEFDILTKVKTMGFISIVEREFKADLASLRQEAKAYYEKHGDEIGVVLDAPIADKKEGKGKVFWLVVLIVLVVGAGWYIATKMDREQLKKIEALIPFLSSTNTDLESSYFQDDIPQKP